MFARHHVAKAVLVATSIVGGLLAQQTWIVAPGGGGHFLDLQTAINAASPGDTLVLRGGSYGAILVDRSLQLVGDQPRPFMYSLQCWPGTTVSMSGLDANALQFPSCRVSLEDVAAIQVTVGNSTASFVGCWFDSRGTMNSTTNLTSNSRAVFDRCQLFGSPGSVIMTLSCTPIPGAPALVVGPGCTAEIANSTLTGADPLSWFCLVSPGTSGLLVHGGGTARVSHSSVASGGASVPAVTGAGAVLHDASQFTPAFGGGTAAFLPIVTGQGAASGAAMLATLTSGPLLPAAVVASIGLHAPVVVSEGTAWVDLAAMVVLRIGVLDPNGQMPVSVPLPPGLLRGLVVTFQGVAAPAASPGLVASTPTMLHVL